MTEAQRADWTYQRSGSSCFSFVATTSLRSRTKGLALHSKSARSRTL